MTRDEIYNAWAPSDSPWSAWAKPVLFAHLPANLSPFLHPTNLMDVSNLPPADGTTTIVADLRGEQGVWAALSLAGRGYRPVPLYNSVPHPRWVQLYSTPYVGIPSAIDMAPLLFALASAAPTLLELPLPQNAPPVFMLDIRRRRGENFSADPGQFDNRSISLPTDFPSGNLLLSKGIKRAFIVTPSPTAPEPDLIHTLLRWQECGIDILTVSLEAPLSPPIPCPLAKPSAFRLLCYKFLATIGMRRHILGGFGGFLPEPESGGG